MMVFIIIKLSIADLSFLPAVFISDILLLFFSFCVILTNSYTFDIMFAKNILLWVSLMLALLPSLYILLIVVYFHCMSVLCSPSILLNRIRRTEFFPSFSYFALHPNHLLFQFGYSFFNHFVSDTFYLICFFYYFLKLETFYCELTSTQVKVKLKVKVILEVNYN